MVEIKNNKDCCGCSACAQICPHKCIEMTEDHEGFLYPKIKADLCVNCGLCEKVCPILNGFRQSKPIKVWAAYTPDNYIRQNSSSGGIFYTVASSIIQKGGVVFGTKYNNYWGAEFAHTETIEGLKELMVSKYVQSVVGAAFTECNKFLKEGRLVFFIGTSCQIAGLKRFLNKDYDNLLTADIVCHGVPSPRVWQLYLDEISREKVENENPRTKIEKVSFRLKNPSWNNFNFYVKFKKDTIEDKESTLSDIDIYNMDDPYMKGFVYNLTLRPSCYYCHFKSCRAGSDFTIADYWGVQKFHPTMADDKGTSMIIVNSTKGSSIIDELSLIKEESSYSKVRYCNPAITTPHIVHCNRNLFFREYRDKVNISEWIEHCLNVSDFYVKKKEIYSILGILIRKIKYGII